MAVKTWTNQSSGNWQTSSLWNGAGIPGTGDDVVITGVATTTIIINALSSNATANSMLFNETNAKMRWGGGKAVTIGNGATLSAGFINLDNAGGTLAVTSGGLLINGGTLQSIGTVTVGAGGAQFSSNAGAASTNVGTIAGGVFTVSAGGLQISNATGGSSTLSLTAGQTNITGGTSLSANGTLNINGGTITTDSLSIGGGTFAESVSTSSFTVTNAATITGGTDSISNGTFKAGTLTIGGTSTTFTLTGGTVQSTTAGGISIGSTDAIAISTGATLNGTTGGIANTGTIRGAGTVKGSITGSGGTIRASGGVLDVTGSIASTEIVTIGTTVGSVLELDAAQSGLTVSFAGVATSGATSLELNDFTTAGGDSLNFSGGTISGMNVGASKTAATNQIIIAGSTPPTGITVGFSGSGTTGTLTIKDGSGATIASIALTGLTGNTSGAEFANWAADSGNAAFTDVWLSNANCFATGTRILTTTGEVAVEALREGDLVITHTGEWRPIKWLGHRHLDLTRHPKPQLAAPVRICRGAFGDDLPRRDLVVSPDHCMFIDGRLIPAKLLINHMTIVQERQTRAVTYHHVELEQHDVLLAEGVATESYLDTGNRAMFTNAGLGLLLHPDFAINAGLKCWETDSCAPLVVQPEQVKPVWQQLAERAETLGYQRPCYATTDDPELCLVAGGRVIRPLSTEANRYVFALPADLSSVRLTSRASIPSDFEAYVDDWRELGVAVRRIIVRDEHGVVELPPDHPGLTKGWYRVERDASVMWRWMDGNAVVPLPETDGPAIVEVHVGMCMTHRVQAQAPQRQRLAA